MAEINVLASSVFNRIAAGEVVENPRSVIKELLENSIDAGADSIAVEITEGGVRSIRVADNGKGIAEEELPLAFLPHATSKITSVDDLDRIGTLGFRGEALPSISSVAKVTMISRRSENPLGFTICYENGKLLKSEEIGAAMGTTVCVEDLFKRIPARAKFLKKPSLEEADVTDLIIKMILSKPQISIKYSAEGKVIYHSNGGGLESAIYTVYGGNILDNLVPISSIVPGITLSGFISKPSYTRHNRTYQTFIVNGRYVSNAEISYCIQQCYQEFLMKRQFPMFVLNLDLPLDMVDVNVHPNKMDVRFVNFRYIKSIIFNAVRQQVLAEAEQPKLIQREENKAPEPNATPMKSSLSPFSFRSLSEGGTTLREPRMGIGAQQQLQNRQTQLPSDTLPLDESNSPIISSRMEPSKQSSELANTQNELPVAKSLRGNATQTPIPVFLEKPQIQIAGKLFNTYILVQEENNVYLIDQHAAHEKILYDRLVLALDSAEICVQDLLLPYIFDVTHTEKVMIDGFIEEINLNGFALRPLSGLSYALSGVPICCSAMNMQEFVSIFVKQLNVRSFKKSNFLKEALMQSACKAAVKGEMNLNESEINALLKDMKQEKSTLFCPHGRPTVLKLTREEIEKWFKRIV